MQKISTSPEIDPVLASFLREKDERASTELLGGLITERAEPLIRQIIGMKLRRYGGADAHGYDGQEADDLCNDVIAEMLFRLRQCKESPAEHPIANFHSYTAVATYHACSEYLRAKYPQRHSLKSKVRHALRNRDGLSQWKTESGELVGGFAAWQFRAKEPARGDRYRKMLEDPAGFSRAALKAQDPVRMRLDELLAAVFDWVGEPVELDDLMSVLASLRGVRDGQEQLGHTEEEEGNWEERLIDDRVKFADEVTLRLYLQHVWELICQLPVRQRMALLLNLKDENGDCLTMQFPILRIASIRQIAGVLELTPDQFAELWHDLPLEDARIAALLGIERQQVINLRKSARERLARWKKSQ